MSDLQSKLDQVKANETWLEKIKRYIPGYDGYVNKDNSRELDTILRTKLANRLEENKTKLKNTVLALSREGKLLETGDLEKLEKKNENSIAKLKSAARGYSGLFDVSKINEMKLNQLYEFDYNLLSYVENLNKGFADLETKANAKEDLKAYILQMSQSLDDLLKKFDERESILRD
ncbi:MAG TPA: hypothetical protein PKC91_10625 [Ignavibacteria bacterium]|nr:hypothetical protein [Ignavibacteria bacterium]